MIRSFEPVISESDIPAITAEIKRIFRRMFPRAKTKASHLDDLEIRILLATVFSAMRNGAPGVSYYGFVCTPGQTDGLKRSMKRDAIRICGRVSPYNGKPSMWIRQTREIVRGKKWGPFVYPLDPKVATPNDIAEKEMSLEAAQ